MTNSKPQTPNPNGQAPTDDWQYGDKLHFSVIAKNFLGQRVSGCEATVTGALRNLAGASSDAAEAVPAAVTCDNTTGSAVYLISVEQVVSDGRWRMFVQMDEQPVLHR